VVHQLVEDLVGERRIRAGAETIRLHFCGR
jgi:hypothetical protein